MMSRTSEYRKARSNRARKDPRKEGLFPPASKNHVQMEQESECTEEVFWIKIPK